MTLTQEQIKQWIESLQSTIALLEEELNHLKEEVPQFIWVQHFKEGNGKDYVFTSEEDAKKCLYPDILVHIAKYTFVEQIPIK